MWNGADCFITCRTRKRQNMSRRAHMATGRANMAMGWAHMAMGHAHMARGWALMAMGRAHMATGWALMAMGHANMAMVCLPACQHTYMLALAQGTNRFRGRGGIMHVENPRYETELHDRFFDAAKAMGLKHNDDFNAWDRPQDVCVQRHPAIAADHTPPIHD
eukprot:364612-Chlamydomonas_euryale.AAC.26